MHSSPCQNGPTQFFSGSKLPLPEEKHNEELYSTHDAHDTPKEEQFDSDSDSDTLEFPEVPKAPVQSNANVATAPDMFMPPAMPHPEVDLHSSTHSGDFEDSKQEQVESTIHKDEPHSSFGKLESKQFVPLPFISPPSVSSGSYTARHSDSPPSFSSTKSEANVDLQNVLAAAHAASETAEHAAAAARHIDPPPSLSSTKSEANLDLQDVIAAAHAAAETAERAAAAARSAASLAQVRISELTKKKSIEHIPDNSSENPFYSAGHNESTTSESVHLAEQNASGNSDGFSRKDHDLHQDQYDSIGSHSSSFPSFDTLKEDFDSSLPTDHVLDDKSSSHQPKRLPSMDDNSYFSYPNLFTSQNSNVGSHSHSDNSRSTYDM